MLKVNKLLVTTSVLITVCVCGNEIEEYIIKLGYLSDLDNGQPSFAQMECMSQWWERRVVIQAQSLSYQQWNKAELMKKVRRYSQEKVNIIIGYIPFMDLSYMHGVLHGPQKMNSSEFAQFEVSDRLWYFSKQNNTSPCGTTEKIFRHECVNKRNVAKFLADVVTDINWRYLSLLYESEYGEEADIITQHLSEQGVRINQHNIQPDRSSLPFIQSSYQMMRRGWRQYLLLANWKTVDVIFHQINDFDAPGLSQTAMKTFSLWLVWGKDVTSHQLQDKVGNISNVAMLERPECEGQYDSPVPTYFQPSHQNDTCDFLKMSWTEDCHHQDGVDEDLNRIWNGIWRSISPDHVARPVFKMSTALWKPDGRQFQTVLNGGDRLVQLTQDDVFPNTLYGLNNMALVVTTLPWPLYTNKHQNPDGSVYYDGFSMELLFEMSRKLNFSYTIVEPEDQEWGRRLENGTWTGLIGDIVHQKADLIYAPISNQKDRNEVMDFTTAYTTVYNVIMMKIPHIGERRWLLLTIPLEWPVVVTYVFLVLPVVAFCLWLCERFSPYYSDFIRKSKFPGLHHFRECLLTLLGGMLSESGNFLPRAHSGRTIVAFWWLFVFLMAATYCGNLYGILAAFRPLKHFNTIAELTEKHNYKWGMMGTTHLAEHLKKSEDPGYQELWQGIERFSQKDPWVLDANFDTHMSKMMEERYAFITDETTADITIEKSCELQRADEKFLLLYYSVGLQNNSAYTSMFTKSVTSITEAGLIEMWKKTWWPKSPPCPDLLKPKVNPIQILDIQAAFHINTMGLVLAIFTLIGEIIHHKCKSSGKSIEKVR